MRRHPSDAEKVLSVRISVGVTGGVVLLDGCTRLRVHSVKFPPLSNFESVVHLACLAELFVFYNSYRPGFSAGRLQTEVFLR